MSRWAETDVACPCGKSSDGFAIDHKGLGYCFSCNKTKRVKEPQDESMEVQSVEYQIKSHRGLSRRTLEFYDIPIAVVNGEDFSYVFKYPNGASKTKKLKPTSRKDTYKWYGEANTAGLFGRDKFPAGSKASITITEGEHDAPSIYEVLGGTTAAVSVQSSSTALRDIEACRDYVNSFDKIILAFDNDEAGQNAVRKIMASGLFDFNKLFYIEFDRHKDANAYMQEGDLEDLARIWKTARKYTPDNIISTFNEIAEALKEAQGEGIGTFPTDELTYMLAELQRGQVHVIKGMEGIGKTEIFRMMEHHLLKTTDCKIGMIHMEESKSTTIKGVATYESGIPCNLPDSQISDEDVLRYYTQAVSGQEDRVFIYTLFGGDNPDDVLDSIRFLVVSGGVDIVFLDHISLLVTGLEEGDERRRLDYLSTKLKKMAKELNFCLVMITHVNDDGQTRGSRNISKIADSVISLHRDKLSEDEIEKNTMDIVIEKNRLTGRTGRAGKLYFSPETFKLEEL